MGKLTRNYIYNVLYQIFVMFVPLFTAPYLARVLGANGTGAYSYVYSMANIVCTFVMLGIYNYGNRQVAYSRDNSNDLRDTFWRIISARIVIAVIGTVVYFSIVFLVNRYVDLFVIFYTYMVAYFVDCTWLYVGVEDMKWAVLKNLLTKVLAVVSIFLFVKDEHDLPIYVLIQGMSMLVANLLAYSKIGKYVGQPKIVFSHVKEDLWGACLLFLPSVAATIYTQCDKVMIELISGASNEVAFYDYSEKIVTIPLTFITVLSAVMMPRIANEYIKQNSNTISELLSKVAKIAMALSLPMTFGLIAIAPKLVPWYLGNDFEPTTNAIIVLAPIIIANSLSGISGGQYFTATDQIGILIKSQFGAAFANVLFNAFLIPRYGFYGAAIATLVTSYSCAGIQYYYLLKQIKLPGITRSFVRYTIISILMFILIFVFTNGMAPSPFTNIIQICIGALFYLGICVILRDEQILYIISKVKSILCTLVSH